MIKKRREEELRQRMNMLFDDAIKPIVRLFQRNRKWQRFLRVAEQIRIDILRNKMSKRVQRMVKHYLVRVRIWHCIRVRAENLEAERIKALHKKACGVIGRYVRRKREIYSLKNRFHLRKLVSKLYNVICICHI
jgi:hypothetical protein